MLGVINHKDYPHIFATILHYSPRTTLLTLRQTSRQVKFQVDNLLLNHIVLGGPCSEHMLKLSQLNLGGDDDDRKVAKDDENEEPHIAHFVATPHGRHPAHLTESAFKHDSVAQLGFHTQTVDIYYERYREDLDFLVHRLKSATTVRLHSGVGGVMPRNFGLVHSAITVVAFFDTWRIPNRYTFFNSHPIEKLVLNVTLGEWNDHPFSYLAFDMVPASLQDVVIVFHGSGTLSAEELRNLRSATTLMMVPRLASVRFTFVNLHPSHFGVPPPMSCDELKQLFRSDLYDAIEEMSEEPASDALRAGADLVEVVTLEEYRDAVGDAVFKLETVKLPAEASFRAHD